MDIEMFGKISDAFGPSGFEEEVVRTVAGYCGKYQVENDAMNNLYVRMPGRAGINRWCSWTPIWTSAVLWCSASMTTAAWESLCWGAFT